MDEEQDDVELIVRPRDEPEAFACCSNAMPERCSGTSLAGRSTPRRRVALATVEVSLREEGVEAVEDVETASLPNAFERSVAGFVGVIAAIVVGIGYLIPLVIIGLVAWFVVSRVRRRRSV